MATMYKNIGTGVCFFNDEDTNWVTEGQFLEVLEQYLGQENFSSDLLGQLTTSATGSSAVMTLMKENWNLTDEDTPALTAVMEHEHNTGQITGSRWVPQEEHVHHSRALWKDADNDIWEKLNMPRLENFSFSNVIASRNILDWMDLQKTDNIKLENKTTNVV